MSDEDEITLPRESLRRLLHDINNVAARVLTKAELALMGDDHAHREQALRAIQGYAEELGGVTEEARVHLLDGPA